MIAILTSIVLAAALAAPASPIAGMHYLVGTWNCTYRAGTVRLVYANTYAYDRDGNILRQTATSAEGGDEGLMAYDAVHRVWTEIVLDDHGSSTVMRGNGSDPNHVSFRSVFPSDPAIAETFDRVSATEYTLHASVSTGGKTTTNVDTCLRAAK